MTKEEKIKEAYGEFWYRLSELQKNYALEFNGYVCIGYSDEQKRLFIDIVKSKLFDQEPTRPKSLRGIETNNGWIKIESEDDLPDEICGLWEVVINGEQKFIELLKDNKSRLYKDFVRDGITHYKIKEKSTPPIY